MIFKKAMWEGAITYEEETAIVCYLYLFSSVNDFRCRRTESLL